MHVWVADLDVPPSSTGLLLAHERARAERFRRKLDGQRWGRAREVLRSLLGRYLRSDPRAVRLATGAHGKPELEEHPPRVHFNLTHAGSVAAYAFASTQPVGVDIELAGRNTDVLAIADRAFGTAETARLRELHVEDREHEFLRLWVRHEAAVKCLGTGLAGAGIDAHGRPPRVSELTLPRELAGAGAVAAVATIGEHPAIGCWMWRDDQPARP